jgi:hypothetical protein
MHDLLPRIGAAGAPPGATLQHVGGRIGKAIARRGSRGAAKLTID